MCHLLLLKFNFWEKKRIFSISQFYSNWVNIYVCLRYIRLRTMHFSFVSCWMCTYLFYRHICFNNKMFNKNTKKNTRVMCEGLQSLAKMNLPRCWCEMHCNIIQLSYLRLRSIAPWHAIKFCCECEYWARNKFFCNPPLKNTSNNPENDFTGCPMRKYNKTYQL